MKTIKVKSFLTEAIKVGDPETAAKLKKRAVDLSRLAKEAKKAANIAAGNGDQELADQLNTRAKELEDLVKNINIDTLDSDPVQPNAGSKSTDTDSKASDKQAEDAEDATVEDIIKQLKGLNGEAKRGAIDGLKDLLDNSKNESLTEAKLREARGLRDMSDDEFGDLVNDTIDMIEKAHPVSTVDDMKERKARITSWANSRIARRDLDTEATADVKAEKQAVKARKKELDQYGHYMSLSQFEISFSEAIKNQVDEVLKEFQTYDEINTEYEDEGIIMKADVEKLDLDEAIPRICVYFDQSGSWNSADIETGKSVIATVKKKYVDTGLCKLDLWYFDDIVTNNAHDYRLGEGGTGAWREILKNIQATNADNVVILTDSDMQYSAINGPTIGVNGCVWFLWKRGINAPACVSHLIGAKGNYEASFKPGETV